MTNRAKNQMVFSVVNFVIFGAVLWHQAIKPLTPGEILLVAAILIGLRVSELLSDVVDNEQLVALAVAQAKIRIAAETLALLAKGKACLDFGCPYCEIQEQYEYMVGNNLEWDGPPPTHPSSHTAKIAKKALEDMAFLK